MGVFCVHTTLRSQKFNKPTKRETPNAKKMAIRNCVVHCDDRAHRHCNSTRKRCSARFWRSDNQALKIEHRREGGLSLLVAVRTQALPLGRRMAWPPQLLVGERTQVLSWGRGMAWSWPPLLVAEWSSYLPLVVVAATQRSSTRIKTCAGVVTPAHIGSVMHRRLREVE